MNFKKAASMIIKKDHGFMLPPLAEESGGSPQLTNRDRVAASSPASVASPARKIAAVVNALRPSSKTPGPLRAFSRASSRATSAMSLARPST